MRKYSHAKDAAAAWYQGAEQKQLEKIIYLLLFIYLLQVSLEKPGKSCHTLTQRQLFYSTERFPRICFFPFLNLNQAVIASCLF